MADQKCPAETGHLNKQGTSHLDKNADKEQPAQDSSSAEREPCCAPAPAARPPAQKLALVLISLSCQVASQPFLKVPRSTASFWQSLRIVSVLLWNLPGSKACRERTDPARGFSLHLVTTVNVTRRQVPPGSLEALWARSFCENANSSGVESSKSLGEWQREPFQRRGRVGSSGAGRGSAPALQEALWVAQAGPRHPRGLEQGLPQIQPGQESYCGPGKTQSLGWGLMQEVGCMETTSD